MARIAGINIPTNKKVFTGLTYIKGIGPKIASDICKQANFPTDRRVNELTDSEVIQIREIIEGNYRGLRHRRGLPVRGQRTHTNARTRKGPAKAIAGKKK